MPRGSNRAVVALAGVLAAAACTEAPATRRMDTALVDLSLRGVSPATWIPGTIVGVAGDAFVDDPWGTSRLRLRGSSSNAGEVDVSIPLAFADFELLDSTVTADTVEALGGANARFNGTAIVEVISAVDGSTYTSSELDLMLSISDILSPELTSTHVVVAGVEVAVVLEREAASADLRVYAERRRLFEELGQDDLEGLYEDLAHVVALEPAVEEAVERPPPLHRPDAAGAHRGVRLVDERVDRPLAAFGLEDLPVLDDGNELEVARADPLQEVVEGGGLVGVVPVQHRQRVEFDAVPLQRVDSPQDPAKGSAAGRVAPVPIVHGLRAIDADTHQEAFGRQKTPPLVVDQRGVGLQGVLDVQTRAGVALLELHGAAEEAEPHQRGLSTLPGELDLASAARLRRDVGLDEALEHLLRHPEAAGAGIETALLQVEAVAAVEVADRPDGLGDHVKGPARPRRAVDCGATSFRVGLHGRPG